MNLRADDRTIHNVETQHCKTRIQASRLKIRSDEAPGEISRPAIHQIHHEERNVTHDVVPAQIGAEFHTVERDEASVEGDDVAEVQIAMAFADHACRAP